ncbi:MAG: hypothetical protein V3S41_05045 [Spirochaetia bacterium]
MKRVAIILLALTVSTALCALEVEEGNVRLTLDEDSSRFLLDIRSSGGRDDWVPLIFPEDPRTSGLDIREGNRIFRIGDGGEFRQVAEVTDEGVFFVWTSATLRVSERFRFIRSVGGDVVDGVQIDITVTNLGEQAVPVGMRLLLDTYLGERGNAHFATPLRQQITREAEIQSSAVEWYIRSTPADGGAGLQVMLTGSGVTTPDQVAVANWKRLSDSDWVYTINENRNFNRLPYSINDSALLLSYGERVLLQNERYEVSVQMGGLADNGFLDPDSSAPVTNDSRLALMDGLTNLLEQIDALLADPNATVQDVANLRDQLQALSQQVPGL